MDVVEIVGHLSVEVAEVVEVIATPVAKKVILLVIAHSTILLVAAVEVQGLATVVVKKVVSLETVLPSLVEAVVEGQKPATAAMKKVISLENVQTRTVEEAAANSPASLTKLTRPTLVQSSSNQIMSQIQKSLPPRTGS